MNEIVQTGRTVAEAEELALAALGADRSEVAVEILNRGRQGFLGIGGEPAEVRVTRLAVTPDETAPEPEAETADAAAADGDAADTESDAAPGAVPTGESAPAGAAALPAGTPAEVAIAALEVILTSVGAEVTATLRAEYDEFAGGPVIDISGPDSGLLIGRRGQTLQSLQFIVQSIVRQRLAREDVRLSLDVEQYRQRREDGLREMADRVASRVRETGRSIQLEPMTPADRRVIHIYLDEQEGVRTESVGYGEDRKVQILPDRG